MYFIKIPGFCDSYICGHLNCAVLWNKTHPIRLILFFLKKKKFNLTHKKYQFQSSNFLFDGKCSLMSSHHSVKHPVLAELKLCYWGCRAVAELKARIWRYKPSVPSILKGNVNYLANKCDALEALGKNQWVYCECNLMFYGDQGPHAQNLA